MTIYQFLAAAYALGFVIQAGWLAWATPRCDKEEYAARALIGFGLFLLYPIFVPLVLSFWAFRWTAQGIVELEKLCR